MAKKTRVKKSEAEETEDSWRLKHSVGCYFCGREFDERDGTPADSMNGGDGGTACQSCARERALNERE